jgi:hypothetical protein
MRDFLKKDLGVKAPIVGTQGFWSPGHLQAGMDVIDSHAYWQHPEFEGGRWNDERWTVKNIPMAGAKDGGTLPGLAAQRVFDKPFICTEYNHSSPNTYGAETAPLLCAFAALQDWDGIFIFAYSHSEKWQQDTFDTFFDIGRHPVKMATLPGAVLSFRRPDIAPAAGIVSLTWPMEFARAQMLKFGPGFTFQIGRDSVEWYLLMDKIGQSLGPRPEGMPEHWHAVETDDAAQPAKAGAWDRKKGLFLSDTKRTKIALGKTQAEANLDLGGIRIIPSANQNDFASYQLSVLDRKDDADFSTAKRILITTTGNIENTGMGWKNAEKSTLGRDWGKAPVLVEGPGAKITLPGDGKFKAWALDERGQRRVEIPVVDGTLEIGPQHRTLWYEVGRE